MTQKRYFAAIDVAKFLCAMVVLFYHYFSEHGPIPSLLEDALSSYAIAVALFMVISGFLTYGRLKNVPVYSERKRIVYRQVKKILIIYALWSIPYLIYSVSQWDFETLTAEFVLWKMQGWVFGSTFYTIWFMPSLAVGTFVSFWLMERLGKQKIRALVALFYILGALQLTYAFAGERLPGYASFYAFSGTWLGGSRGWLFFAFPLVTLGGWAAERQESHSPIKDGAIAVGCAVMLLAEALIIRKLIRPSGIDTGIFMIPLTYFGTRCLSNINISVKQPVCKWLRNMSTVVFMSQRLFLTVIPCYLPVSLWANVNENPYIGACIVCGVSIAFAAGLILISKYLKPLRHLY